MDFEEAFARLIDPQHEGGFQNAHDDRGNWTGGEVGKGKLLGTKYGISAMTYPGEDIENLTLERAKELYRRDFWGPAGCDAVPDALKFDLFDMAVNSGKGNAIRTLQKACGEHEDGVLGPRTLQAMSGMNPVRLVARFNGARLLFLADTRTWSENGRGWARRVGNNLLEA
jgi:lysozyme family protein